jgi:hypothetical protein
MSHWEYLEVAIDLSKRSWKDSSGRRGRLRKGSTAPVLTDLGQEGWELSGTVPLDRASGAYRLYFKRPQPAPEADTAQSDAPAGAPLGDRAS